MTTITLNSSSNGEFRSCYSEGHAEYAPAGSDIGCAAITAVLRTTLEVLLDAYGASVFADTTTRGTLAFRVEEGVHDRARLVYAADFLRQGLMSLQSEYPKHVMLRENIVD